MAVTALSLAGKLLEVLGSSAYEQITSAWGVEEEFKQLQYTLKAIKSVLIDAEEKQGKNQGLRLWLEGLKDVLYDLQDVADDFEIQAAAGKVCGPLSCFNPPIAFRFRMRKKLAAIQKRLAQIDSNKNQFGLSVRSEDVKRHEGRRETSSFMGGSPIIGRDEDREKIFRLLSQPNNDRRPSVIPIVGFGGQGKTTLARLVYHDSRVIEHFELKIWICVSDEFNSTDIIKQILKSINPNFLGYDSLNLEQLSAELTRVLEKTRFLLVLDDVWNENQGKWQDLSQLLIGKEGSKVLVTTRSKLAAAVVNPDFRYDLGHLPHDHCLLLFKRWARIEGEEVRHPKLVELGNEMVNKCGGNPLAAKTLGSLLSGTRDEKEWSSVKDSEIWELEGRGRGLADDDIMPVLKLSYRHLASHLKPCFAYSSVFPKDFRFNSMDLIQLWIANGLIPSYGGCEPEFVGMQYLKELWGRCFFEDVEERVFVYSFKMHDLMHDLAISVAGDEFRSVNSLTKDLAAAENVRHLSLFEYGFLEEKDRRFLNKWRKCRTLICPIVVSGALAESNIGRFITSCESLWVLDLSSSSFEELPSSIGLLIHLRYLSLSGNRRLRRLPGSIQKLTKLQALGLAGCKRLDKLPDEIAGMVNLRLLEVTIGSYAYELPADVFRSLTSLQIMSVIGCRRLRGLASVLQNRPSIRTLCVVDCSLLHGLGDEVNLMALEELLISNSEDALNSTGFHEDLVDNRRPALRTITLVNLDSLTALPDWLQRCANTLEQIIIQDCQNLGELPQWLQKLTSLQKLVVTGCPRLSALPKGMDHLVALRELRLGGHPSFIDKCRREVGEYWPMIAHVPQIHLHIAKD